MLAEVMTNDLENRCLAGSGAARQDHEGGARCNRVHPHFQTPMLFEKQRACLRSTSRDDASRPELERLPDAARFAWRGRVRLLLRGLWLANGQHGNVREANHLFRDASDEGVAHALPSVGPHHDQVGTDLFAREQDLLPRGAPLEEPHRTRQLLFQPAELTFEALASGIFDGDEVVDRHRSKARVGIGGHFEGVHQGQPRVELLREVDREIERASGRVTEVDRHQDVCNLHERIRLHVRCRRLRRGPLFGLTGRHCVWNVPCSLRSHDTEREDIAELNDRRSFGDRPPARAIGPDASIASFMTRSPHCIGKDQKLAAASSLMRTAQLRHLPVLDAGRLVGMLSQRDIYFVETIQGVDPVEVSVEDAMTQEAYQVHPTARLHAVVGAMAKKKLGSAVVVEAGKVVGMFTTTDALRVLSELLSRHAS